jgi:hypothetical protein
MIKRRGGNQIGNLTLDCKTLEHKGQMKSDLNMLYTVGNIFSKDIRYCPHTFEKDLIWEKYEHPKFWDNKNPNFGTPTWEFQGKNDIWM